MSFHRERQKANVLCLRNCSDFNNLHLPSCPPDQERGEKGTLSRHEMYVYNIKGLVTNYGEVAATKREGGARKVLPLQKGGGGGKSFSHAERGGAQKVLDPRIFHFVAPPLPVINDQSLSLIGEYRPVIQRGSHTSSQQVRNIRFLYFNTMSGV